MKATPMTQHPDFSLLKQTDIQAFYHLQMPRWLFSDGRYRALSLEAKVTYSFLLNRFQLSKLNGWINDNGEVFIIYTRESLSAEIQISYKKVIESMKLLAAAKLIYERRCGRGDANQIYLAKVDTLEDYDTKPDSAPFITEETRCAETAVLEFKVNTAATDDFAESRHAEPALHDMPKKHVKNGGNGTSAPAVTAGQDIPKRHTSNTNPSKTKKKNIERKSVKSARGDVPDDERTDADVAELARIIDGCDLWTFPYAVAKVFENAIERLFFTELYHIGDALLPRKKVRAGLHQLDNIKLQDAAAKIAANTDRKIKNTTAYTMAVVFNSIWECESDVMCDPYLNGLRMP